MMCSRFFIPAAAAICLAAACTTEPQPVEYSMPVVEYGLSSEEISASVGDALDFTATVVSGERVSCAWYVDGCIESSAQSFTYSFATPGRHEVRFEAKNGAGTAEKTYVVNVTDVFRMALSVGDSTEVTRLQLDYLKVAAIVESGSGISHRWTVDGILRSEDAYFGTFQLVEAKDYTVSYVGSNNVGSFEKTFTVHIIERPLEVAWTVTDNVITLVAGTPLSISAVPLYGLNGLKQKWTVDGAEVSTGNDFTWTATKGGTYTIEYSASNAKGETVSRSWTVIASSRGYVFDDFEGKSALSPWWTLGQNSPGIQLCENPLKSGINTSDWCMSDSVAGTGSTSGYFDLKCNQLADVDVAKYSKVRIKIYLGKNKYYPRIQYNGVKYPPVASPKFNDEWEELEFDFGQNLDPSKNLTFRPMLKEDGSNIASGAVTETNTRIVYIDDIEFVE